MWGLCTINSIKVQSDGDPHGSADMTFTLSVNDTSKSLHFKGVNSGDTLQVNKSFQFPTSAVLRLRFHALDHDGGAPFDPNDDATGTHNLDTIVNPLPMRGATFRVKDEGVEATISFDLELLSLLSGTTEPVSLRCLGEIPGPGSWLDGNTATGRLSLSPHPREPYSGASWRVHFPGDDRVAFECLGNVAGAKWLDGNTVTGRVSLVPELGGRFTGTLWRVHATREGKGRRLECLGNIPGPKWLDGNTVDGSLRLAPDTEIGFSGTRWSIENTRAAKQGA